MANTKTYHVQLPDYDLLREGDSIEEVRRWAKQAFPGKEARVTRDSATRLCDGCSSRPCVCE